ncbi:MAG TPA: PLP-dependent aspartate aminotransferase family protein [Gammaproteobacteria bacterium]
MHDKLRLETLAVHAGHEPETGDHGLAPAFKPATTFLRDADGGFAAGHQYARASNPTRARLENALALLEGGGEALCFSSGMAAVGAVFAQLAPGDHAIVSGDAYHGAIRFIDDWLKPRGIGVTYCDTSDTGNIERELQPKTRLLWLESPSNPELKITDLAAVAALAANRGILTACDATLATPVLQRTLDHGIDIVMHSSTKYLGGHSDLLGGVLATRDAELAAGLRAWQIDGGAVPSAFDCWLLLRSLATLPLRVKQHAESARRIAAWLTEQTAVEKVFYPGLAAHPGHETAKRQMRDFGGMVSFLFRGDEDATRAVASRTKIFQQATSLGGVESLIEHRASVEGAQRRSAHNLLRLSVGLEHADDLIADLSQALKE